MDKLNDFLSGSLLPFLLISSGLFFAIKLKFFYIFQPIKSLKSMLKGQGGFKSLSVALAGTLGIGNIVGVASAISLGGAGSIFWMWISAFFAMSLKYAEVVLAMVHRRNEGGKFHGGAPYYINEGLKDKLGKKPAYFLSCAFAVFCAINSLTTGNLVQISSVAKILPVNSLLFGIIIALFVFLCTFGGFKQIERITSFLIPALTFVYTLLCIVIILKSINKIPHLFETIFKDAFAYRSAVSGFCGYGIASSIRYGVSRGVLSNEAGCGTSPCAHASSSCSSAHAQGCLGILEVFVDTILLCSLSAFVILLNGIPGLSSMELVLFSFEAGLGRMCANTVSFLCIMFAFATVITQYFYGEESIKYISQKAYIINIFKMLFCFIIVVASVIPMWLMWEISDFALSVMTIINIICLLLLRKNIK